MDDSDRLSTLREQLAKRLGQQRYELWLGPQTSLKLESSTLLVGCPSQFQVQGLRRRLHDVLLKCSRHLWGEKAEVRYVVDTSLQTAQELTVSPSELAIDSQPELAKPTLPPASSGGLKAHSASVAVAPTAKQASSPAKSRGTFGSFVIGKGNEVACRTAQTVAEQPGQYSPLLIHGPPGVGKTHLLQSIRQQLRKTAPRKRVLYLTAEQFTAQFLEALDRRTLPSFRQKYRTIDVLLVEDIQFLSGKRATLDELIHTIDTLQDRGQQVVLSCDRSPGQLQEISGELVSRISGGLPVPVDPADYATRVGIVRSLAGRLQVALDEEVVNVVASMVAGSARQLSGALNRLVASSQAWNEPITVSFARQTLVEFVQQSAPAVQLADIQRAVCQVFRVEPTSLKSARKTRSVAEPRMLAMWLARKYTRSALSEIGDYFGRRSHSTVISAQRKINDLMSKGAEFSVADRPCPVEEAIRQVEDVLRTA